MPITQGDAKTRGPKTSRKRRARREKRHQGYGYDALHLSKEKEAEFDTALPGQDSALRPACVERALLCADMLSRHAKDPSCPRARREGIYHLKNMALRLLWQEMPPLFEGVWLYASQGDDQVCWRCDGAGNEKNSLERCSKCRGSGRWKDGDKKALVVFAIRTSLSRWVWRIPASIARQVLGRAPEYGEDLITSGRWQDESPQGYLPMSDEQYEESRSFVAWFLAGIQSGASGHRSPKR